MHLATLFPEARLKRIIEMRGVDGQTLPFALASSALFKGLFYDERSFAQTVARVTEEIRALGPLDWPHNWPNEDPYALQEADS